MIYTVRRWKHGFGIWHGWHWFAWRVRYVGPFGFDAPWLFEMFAEDKAYSLSNAPRQTAERSGASLDADVVPGDRP
jgi:hypothetical protein